MLELDMSPRICELTNASRIEGDFYLTGYHRVKVAADTVQAPDSLSLHLLHIVASHHGQIEHGAAREPMTREAIVVHYADELSAQLMQANRAITECVDPSARWISRVRGLKRDVFIGRPFEDPETR